MKFGTIYLLIINALGLLLMLIDKQKAKKNHWRIPEAVLLGVCFLGGVFGCYLGMVGFRHKTRKPAFYIGIPIILAIYILVFVAFCA